MWLLSSKHSKVLFFPLVILDCEDNHFTLVPCIKDWWLTDDMGQNIFTYTVNFLHKGHHLNLSFSWETVAGASIEKPAWMMLLSHCSLLWEFSMQLPSDMELKTFPEKPIRQRLLILGPQAASVVSPSESAPYKQHSVLITSLHFSETQIWLDRIPSEYYITWCGNIIFDVTRQAQSCFVRSFSDSATTVATLTLDFAKKNKQKKHSDLCTCPHKRTQLLIQIHSLNYLPQVANAAVVMSRFCSSESSLVATESQSSAPPSPLLGNWIMSHFSPPLFLSSVNTLSLASSGLTPQHEEEKLETRHCC